MTDYIAVMLNKTYGNTSLAIVLFNKLFTELFDQVEQIEQALEKNDLLLAKEITHKLHGSISFCGFTDIQKLAKSMEFSLAEQQHPEILKNNFYELKTNINSFLLLKDTILNQLATKSPTN